VRAERHLNDYSLHLHRDNTKFSADPSHAEKYQRSSHGDDDPSRGDTENPPASPLSTNRFIQTFIPSSASSHFIPDGHNKELFIDLVAAIPDNTDWSMQSAFPEVYEAMTGIPYTRESINIELKFNFEFRDQILRLAQDDLYQFINFLEVSLDGKKLVEAYDGFVMVTLSKDFDISKTSLPKHIDTDGLYISDSW